MKMLVVLLIALVPAASQAEKTYYRGKGSSWDCTRDPVVYINHGNAQYKLTGACSTITVNGGNNRLTIEDVETLAVNGNNNIIKIATVGAISVNGSDNLVLYKAAKADKVKSDTLGSGNTVEQRK